MGKYSFLVILNLCQKYLQSPNLLEDMHASISAYICVYLSMCLSVYYLFEIESKAQAGLELTVGKNDFGLLIFLLLLPSTGITA